MQSRIVMVFALILTACGGGNAPAPGPAPAFSPSVVILEGDSLTDINPRTGTTWPTVVQARTLWSASWTNQAVSRSTMPMIIARYSSFGKPRSAAGVFIVNGGTNDLIDSQPAEVYALLKTEWALARADGFKVVATTLHAAGTRISLADSYARVAALNTLIRSNPALYDALVENDKIIPDPEDKALLVDGIHFTPEANTRVAAAVEAALSRLR